MRERLRIILRGIWLTLCALGGESVEEPEPVDKGPLCVCGSPVAYRAYCPTPIGARERPLLVCQTFGRTLFAEYGARLEPLDGEAMLAPQEMHNHDEVVRTLGDW